MADNTSQIAGLFMTPELYQQQQNQAALGRFAEMAQMDPLAQARASLMYGGYQAGNALAGALGAQDPMMQQLSAVNSVMKQVNPNDPTSLMRAAQQLAPVAPQQAAQLAQQARAAQEQIAKISSEGLVGQLLRTGKYTPESIAKYQETGKSADLDIVDKFAKPEADFVAKAVELGFGDKPYYGAYSPEQVQKINEDLFNQDIRKKAAGRNLTNINMPAGDTAFMKEMGALDAKRIDAAMTARDSAVQQLQIAERLQKTSPEALSGQFANTRMGMVNFLDSVGLTSPADKKKLLASQTLTADSSRLVLAALNNKLGGGVSNQDAQRIEQIFPQLENSPAARAELINIIVRSSQRTIDDVNRMEEYARTNNGLKGYKLRIPTVNPTTTPASQLTTEQLKAIAGVQ